MYVGFSSARRQIFRKQRRMETELATVVNNGNCSGCGGCLLLSSDLSLEYSDDGFLRPVIPEAGLFADSADLARSFRAVCPGVQVVHKVSKESRDHPVFGQYISAWQGWATDDEIRFAGSSGGVITALSTWLLETGQTTAVSAVTQSSTSPTRSVPVRLMTRDEALGAAGSRYAPVAAAIDSGPGTVTVAKPCEISAIQRFRDIQGLEQNERPLTMSFFCAGTPSQLATDELVSSMEPNASNVEGVRYRGQGWPGFFTVSRVSGKLAQMTYKDSWGGHLGKRLQWRCKICVDGTGQEADISVGDFWSTDGNGYPSFSDGNGRSVIICRSARAHHLLSEAVAAGVVEVDSVSLDEVARIQPLQTDRKITVVGRLVGRLLSGRTVPKYVGFGVVALAVRNPYRNLRALAGTYLRSRRLLALVPSRNR